jgi:Secretion system C-terminal sorting domain
MKKILFFVSFMCFINTFAQTSPLDLQLVNVNQNTVTSGIIYERSSRFANLYEYNQIKEKPHNTSDFKFFKQALAELYKASNRKKLISTKQLEDLIIQNENQNNFVDIGIINTPFQFLNYNVQNPNEGGLILKNDYFEQIPNKIPFFDGYAFVIAPLKDNVSGQQITYRFKNEFFFNNGDISIKNLSADFGDGTIKSIIVSGILINQNITIENFKINGLNKIKFIVELTKGIKFETYGSIYSNNKPLTIITNQTTNNFCNDDPNNPIENFEVNSSTLIKADEAFQGIQGQIQARVFYHNSANNQKTLLKPIIVVDGFDPRDARKIQDCDCENDNKCKNDNENKITGIFDPINHKSLYDLMNYFDPILNKDKNLVSEFRQKGYDVILVNQPNYLNNGTIIDGGADYIVRNALALVSLIKKVNVKLQNNFSNEELVIMGPSMGGQISRYALAYMEKKFAETGLPEWNHNTRIWVAFDSPNHGANIPMADQAFLSVLADEDPDALKSYENLQSIAARELLIDFYKVGNSFTPPFPANGLNFIQSDNSFQRGSTSTQGMPTNAGSPEFQNHYNNQFNNGLPGSKGFPQNLRKLAIVNGSLSGASFGNDHDKILDVKYSAQICVSGHSWFLGWSPSVCYTQELFNAQLYSKPSLSTSNIISKSKIGFSSKEITASNWDIRGNLDNLPGGAIDATGIIYSTLTGNSLVNVTPIFNAYLTASFYSHINSGWETLSVTKPNQCFIPTYSSIGIKNPNQSWANPLNRNLVCDPNNKETYFDSYFGESENTPHVSLNIRSVNWILKELGDNVNPPVAQAPWFPIDVNALSGPSIICENINTTFSFPDICKVPSDVVWTIAPNAQIVTSSAYSVIVRGISNGSATLTATFQNGQTINKTIWIGKPGGFLIDSKTDPRNNAHSRACIIFDNPNYTLVNQGVTNIETLPINHPIRWDNCFRGFLQDDLTDVVFTNACGSITVHRDNDNIIAPTNTNTSNFYKIYPNPATNIVNIDLKNQDLKPEINSIINAQLFNMMGEIKGNIAITNNIASINTIGLPRGIYVLKINVNGIIESHQVAIE